MPLDYPYAVLPGIEPAKASAARVLFELLTTAELPRPAGRAVAARAGRQLGCRLQGPAGCAEPGRRRRPHRRPAAAPPRAAWTRPRYERAVSSWSIATQSGRMLAVIDVSGSMKDEGAHRQQRHPGAGHRGRRPAAASSLFDDSWSIGLWTFSTKLVGARDYRQVRPDRAAVRPAGAAGAGAGRHQAVRRQHRPVRHHARRVPDGAGGLAAGPGQLGGALHRRQERRQERHLPAEAALRAEATQRPGAAGAGRHHRYR